MGRVQKWLFGAVLVLGVSVALGGSGEAQVLGTFCWRLDPQTQFGEIVSFSVAQQGSVFVLSGSDVLPTGQGGGRFATFGTAVALSATQFKMGFTTVFDNFSAHTSTSISASTLSGTWNDDGGNSGQFTSIPCP